MDTKNFIEQAVPMAKPTLSTMLEKSYSTLQDIYGCIKTIRTHLLGETPSIPNPNKPPENMYEAIQYQNDIIIDTKKKPPTLNRQPPLLVIDEHVYYT